MIPKDTVPYRYLSRYYICMCSRISEPGREMGNGKSGGKAGAGTGIFAGLTGLLRSLSPVPALLEAVRASPNTANLPSRIRYTPNKRAF